MNITEKNYLEDGYTGLANLGNTCFLNSCVQILTHTIELHKIFQSSVVQKLLDTNKAMDECRVLLEWKALAELMWSGNGVVNPMRFVKSVHEIATRKGIEVFTGWAQNDVTEFLRFIINCFHTAIARPVKISVSGKPKTELDNIAVKCCNMLSDVYKKEYSEIYAMFYGISVTEIKNTAGKICSHKPEHFFMIDLPIPDAAGNKSLYDCFDLFVKAESMTGDNQWFNDKTGAKEDVSKRTFFWSLPKTLIITLKRFSVNSRGRVSRIDDIVDCPLDNLNLSKYVEGYDSKKHVYTLYGLSNHMGTPSGGHYTSYIKTGRGWVHFNDGKLDAIGDQAVISSSAYCLFYKRQDV